MKRTNWLLVAGLLIIFAGAGSLIFASAKPLLGSGAPSLISYGGVVNESGIPYQGSGYLKLAVVDGAGATSYWSNDGTSSGGSEPTAGFSLDINEGYFQVLLGDTSIINMTAISASVFGGTERYMRVWFSPDDGTYTILSPDIQIASVPYALQAQEAADADTVDGLHASQLVANYQNVVIVAKSGGDFTSIQAAIDSISDASAANPYLVWIAPGVYNETVTLKSYIHLEGAGQDATIITNTVTNSSTPPTQATMVMASDTSVRDLTVENEGTDLANVGLLNAGTKVLVENLTVNAKGSGTNNYAIYLTDLDTVLRHVIANSYNAIDTNFGLYNTHWSWVTLEGGKYQAAGGVNTYGIFSTDDVTTLIAYDTTALGENGTTSNYGLYNAFGSQVTLFGGFFTGYGGTNTYGIFDHFLLIAEDVQALGESASGVNIGILSNGSLTELKGGSYTGKGGTDAFGISIDNGGIDGYNIKSYAESASNSNYGLSMQNESGANLYGGSITAVGGVNTFGIYISLTDGYLKTRSTDVVATDGTSTNYGLFNDDAIVSRLVGGSLSASHGLNTYAIYNTGSSAIIEAQGLYIQGEFGSGTNYGIYNTGGATTSCTYCVVDGLTN